MIERVKISRTISVDEVIERICNELDIDHTSGWIRDIDPDAPYFCWGKNNKYLRVHHNDFKKLFDKLFYPDLKDDCFELSSLYKKNSKTLRAVFIKNEDELSSKVAEIINGPS